VFLTRHLSFNEDNRTWEGYYHNYLDGRCKRPQFTTYVAGKYVYGSASRLVENAHEVDFQVLKARVKPSDAQIVKLLNTFVEGFHRCGMRKWELNQEQDVTMSEGCQVLGMEVPHIEYELVRMEKNHHNPMLFLGQRPTHGNNFSPSRRPTSFQGPLVRCSDKTRAVTPAYSFHQVAVVRSLDGAATTLRLNPSVLIVSLVLATWVSLMRQPDEDTMD
jgi:hypothetical protein